MNPLNVAFLFPGQGSQYPGMLSALKARLPGFGDRVRALDQHWQEVHGQSLEQLIDRKLDASDEVSLSDTRIAQPAIGLVSIALAQTAATLGLSPRFAVGHSYGELVALCFAGALNERTLLHLSYERGRILGEAGDKAPGGMLALSAPAHVGSELCAGHRSVVIANFNAPNQVVLSGNASELTKIQSSAKQMGVRAVRLRTSCAFHSPLIAAAVDPWRTVLDLAEIAAPTRVQVIASATATAYPASADAVRAALSAQVTSPIRWVETIEHLYERGARVFVEVGPGRVLTELVRQILGDREFLAVALDSGENDASRAFEALLQTSAALKRAGINFALEHATKTGALASPPLVATDFGPLGDTRRALFETNARMLERVFAQQKAMLDSCGDFPVNERSRLLTAAIESNERVMRDYLATQEHCARAMLDRGATEPLLQPAPATKAPESSKAGPAAVTEAENLESWLRTTLADLTGFAVTTIQRSSDLEADLGLDSITTLEVYLLLVEKYPRFAGVGQRIRAARTLGGLVDMLTALDAESGGGPGLAKTPDDGSDAVPAPPSSRPRPSQRHWASGSPNAGTRTADLASEIERLIDARVAKDGVRSGGKGAFGDLDIFAREDLAEELVAAFPALAVAGRALSSVGTVRELLSLCERIVGAQQMSSGTDFDDGALVPGPDVEPSSSVTRFIRKLVSETAPETWRGGRLLLVGRPGREREALGAEARSRGAAVTELDLALGSYRVGGDQVATFDDVEALTSLVQRLRSEANGSATSVIFVAGEGDLPEGPEEPTLDEAGTSLFALVKALRGSPSTEIASLSVFSSAVASPAWAAARGVARGVGREWPELPVAGLTHDGAFSPSRALDLLCSGNRSLDLVLRGDALFRFELERMPIPEVRLSQPLSRDSLVVLFGGGKGITAEMAVKLAEETRCKIAIIGRTPFPTEGSAASPAGGGTRDDARKASSAAALLSTRRRIEALGSVFLYEAADATCEVELVAALDRIRRRAGPIHGVVFGVGVTEDALVGAKSIASFRRVLKTKALAALFVRRLTADDPLKFALFLSSMAAHTGSRGQTDYIAANEIVNALAREWNASVTYPVRSLLWSVWNETGLASPALRRQMERLRLRGITNSAGTEAFYREVCDGRKEHDWVLLAPEETLRFASAAEGGDQETFRARETHVAR